MLYCVYEVDQSNFLSGVWVAADYRQNLVAEILKNFKYNFSKGF